MYSTIGTTAAMAIVAVFLLVSPALGSAVQPTARLLLTAPYKGTAMLYNVYSTQGCGKARLTTPGFFNFSSGAAGLSGAATGKSCRGGITGFGSVAPQLTIDLLLPHFVTGTTIYVNGTYALTGSLSVTPGTCHYRPSSFPEYCDRGAQVSMSTAGYFQDATARRGASMGSFYVFNNSYFYGYCNKGTCSNSTSGASGLVSVSGSFSFVYNVTSKVRATHTYYVEFDVYSDIIAECSAQNSRLTGCSDSASMNFGTAGNGFVVNSIVLT